jgi:hypothetical protein
MGFRVWVECSKYASHMTGTADGRGGLIPLVPKDLADATWDGQKKALTPYHGYFFRILEGQGPHAPGGARGSSDHTLRSRPDLETRKLKPLGKPCGNTK